jgi:hypothetical protein
MLENTPLDFPMSFWGGGGMKKRVKDRQKEGRGRDKAKKVRKEQKLMYCDWEKNIFFGKEEYVTNTRKSGGPKVFVTKKNRLIQ